MISAHSGSAIIRPALKELIQYAGRNSDWQVMGSVDAHTEEEDVRHLAKWPRHGMKGTPGQQKIPETQLAGTIFVSMQKMSGQELASIVQSGQPVYFEKQERPEHPDADTCLSCAVNPNVVRALELAHPDLVVVGGVVLGYCVRDAINYISGIGYRVAIATDAVKEFDPSEFALYGMWQKQGIILTNVRTIVTGGLEKRVQGVTAA